jgi:hypothetical protein
VRILLNRAVLLSQHAEHSILLHSLIAGEGEGGGRHEMNVSSEGDVRDEQLAGERLFYDKLLVSNKFG